MGYINFRMDKDKHIKMREIATKEKKDIIDVYREAVDAHIQLKAQETLTKDTNLEEFINKRITKSDERIAGLVARVGMDSSINVMGLTLLLSKLMKVDREEIYEMLRKEAAQYFSRPYQNKNKEKE